MIQQSRTFEQPSAEKTHGIGLVVIPLAVSEWSDTMQKHSAAQAKLIDRGVGKMPFIRFVSISGEFENSEDAAKVLSSVIQQFRGGEIAARDAASLPAATGAVAVLPPSAAVHAPTAAPVASSRAVAETCPPPRPAAKPGLARKRADKAAAPGEASPAGAGISVSGAIRQVLKGAGSLTVELVFKRVEPLIAPRVTNKGTINTLLSQLERRGEIERTGDGVYCEKRP